MVQKYIERVARARPLANGDEGASRSIRHRARDRPDPIDIGTEVRFLQRCPRPRDDLPEIGVSGCRAEWEFPLLSEASSPHSYVQPARVDDQIIERLSVGSLLHRDTYDSAV